jgi:hypothetical protein
MEMELHPRADLLTPFNNQYSRTDILNAIHWLLADVGANIMTTVCAAMAFMPLFR